MVAMWGEVELEPEARDWFVALDETDAARVRFHIDRLAELGPLLDEPHTRQLDVKTQRQERREIRRPKQALERCVAERHTLSDEEEE